MELLAPSLAQLGLAGSVFVVLLALLQLGLTQFVKVVLKRWGAPVQGSVVLLISLAVGGLLGGMMLGRAAGMLDITLPDPWAGIVAGLVLAATVSGLVSYAQQRTAERRAGQVTPDVLAGLIAELAAARPRPTTPPATPLDVPAPCPTLDGTRPDELRPITPDEALSMTRTDWPAVPGVGPDR